MKIAQIDIFYGGKITEAAFNLSNQEPFNEHFNQQGINDLNYLNNIGSLIWPIFTSMLLV